MFALKSSLLEICMNDVLQKGHRSPRYSSNRSASLQRVGGPEAERIGELPLDVNMFALKASRGQYCHYSDLGAVIQSGNVYGSDMNVVFTTTLQRLLLDHWLPVHSPVAETGRGKEPVGADTLPLHLMHQHHLETVVDILFPSSQVVGVR